MIRILLLSLALGLYITAVSQTRIDGNFAFQSDPAKKYSIYVPSGYNATTPHRLMLALHPFNTNRWDAQSWCDTLINFAAMNNLILACPDGGADGKIDDPIDTAFTSALLDSMAVWYNIDAGKTYCMGFSWGGQTTYSYGLNHVNEFGGFLPIGSAMSGTGLVNSVLNNAAGKPWYIVHGSFDSPSARFYPIRDSVIANAGIVNTMFMSGVGHTIDFPNRNQILSVGFQWIDSVNCAGPVSIREIPSLSFQVYPTVLVPGANLNVKLDAVKSGPVEVTLFDLTGRGIGTQTYFHAGGIQVFGMKIPTAIAAGKYIASINFGSQDYQQPILLLK